jgi:hypothetical protein
MAYNLLSLQVNRGTPFANTQGQGLTAVAHTYKSTVDTLAQIAAPAYFPPNFHTDLDAIFAKDWLFIVDKNGATSFVNITGLNPVTLGADLFTAGSLNVVAPIAPIDNNGIVISGTNVSLEFAALGRPGIVSTQPQVFDGVKTLVDGMRVNGIDGILNADMMFIGNNQTSTITIGGTLANVLFPGGIITDLINNVGAGSTLAVHALYDGITIIGQDVAAVTTGIRTNKIDTISAGGFPLVIGAITTLPIEIGSNTIPTLIKGGVTLAGVNGGGTVNYFNEFSTTVNWQGPFAASVQGKVTATRRNNIVTMTISKIPATATTSSNVISVGGIIPAALRPLVDVFEVAYIIDNTVFGFGAASVNTSGGLVVYANAGQGPFANAGVAGFENITMSWDVTNV